MNKKLIYITMITLALFAILYTNLHKTLMMLPEFYANRMKSREAQRVHDEIERTKWRKYCSEIDAQLAAKEVNDRENTAALSVISTDDNKTNYTNNIKKVIENNSGVKSWSLVNGMESFIESVDEVSAEYGLPPIVYPYRNLLDEVNGIAADKGYDRDQIHNSYSRLYNSKNGFIQSDKMKQMIKVAETVTPDKFMEFLNDFVDRNSLEYLLIKVDVHHSQGSIEKVFDDIKVLLDLLETYQTSTVIKESIVYYVLRTATVFGYVTEEGQSFFEDKKPSRVNFGCLPILAALGF